jgi:glucose-1-phosphate thymidylyltransferase
LAGGAGTRLHPLTKVTSKQLLPVYNKPLIYYPLSTLMMAGIREILLISTPKDKEVFQNLLGDGSSIGIELSFEIQDSPNGLAEAFLIGEDFIGDSATSLILGDNIFHGPGFGTSLKNLNNLGGAIAFATWVSDPKSYGVVEFGADKIPVSIVEKPINPKSNYAIPGLYFFDNRVVKFAKNIKPSPRGELEITSILDLYMQEKNLEMRILPRGVSWFDAGTFDSLLEASEHIRIQESRHGLMVGNLEEISWRNGWITDQEFIDNSQLTYGLNGKKYSEVLVAGDHEH